MQLNSLKPQLSVSLKGVFINPAPYYIREPSGSYEKYWGKWERQKKYGLDYNVCWTYAGIEKSESEIQMMLAYGLIPKETVEWLKANHYIDADGDVFLSRRFIATISGSTFNGNDEANHWELAKEYGLIPDAMFPFKDSEQGYTYFDKSKITAEMYTMGKEFLKRFKITNEELGGYGARYTRRDIQMIRTALLQAPLQIGVPIPKITDNWNKPSVKWDGEMDAKHSVELSGITDKGEYIIYDQYEPCRKVLSADYFLPIITRSIITAIPVGAPIVSPVSQTNFLAQLYRALAVFFGFNATDPQVKKPS